MKVLVVGGGGREHALALALSGSATVVACPGNPGLAADGIDCVPGPPEQAARGCDLVVVGPEAPLVDGLADRLRAAGIPTFGPGADGARLEGSKAWMKEVVAAAGVPTAAARSFGPDETDEAETYLRSLPAPWVVKTDGLAAGKGVLVTDDVDEAAADLRSKLAGTAFGDAGRRVVIEEGMTGPELSVLALVDGTGTADGIVILPPARDHKRLRDGDRGPNTGGMGAYSPVPGVPDDIESAVRDRFVLPTLAELRRRGIDYRGVLYAGLMLTPTGPRLVEYNIRFGDPECQVVLPRLDGNLAALLLAAANGDLAAAAGTYRVLPTATVTVVMAAGGYPEAPHKGDVIDGLGGLDGLDGADGVRALDGVQVLHAGTATDAGRVVTAGGRVLNVVGQGATPGEARDRAYRAVDAISWPGAQYRTDIGKAL